LNGLINDLAVSCMVDVAVAHESANRIGTATSLAKVDANGSFKSGGFGETYGSVTSALIGYRDQKIRPCR